MKKIFGSELSFVDGEDTLLPAGAAPISFATKATDLVLQPGFLGPTNNFVQLEASLQKQKAAGLPSFGESEDMLLPASTSYVSLNGGSPVSQTDSVFTAPIVDTKSFSLDAGSNLVSPTTLAGSSSETVAFATSGIVFVNTYTANVTQAFKNNILAAEQDIAAHWTNSVTLKLTFDAQARGTNSFLATNSWPSFVAVSYTALKNALAAHDAANPDAQAAVAALPATDPNPAGGNDWNLPEAYARMLGLSQSAPATDDTIILNTSFNWAYGQDVVATMEHEITEGAMGRVGGLGDQNHVWSTMDLFRFSAVGVRDFTDGRDGKSTFFSVDGSQLLLQFNNEFSGTTKVNSNDTADYVVSDVFGTGSPGDTRTLSATDLKNMNVLGWTPVDTSAHIFATPTFQLAGFAPGAGGWTSDDKYPRKLADINGDHMADIVGFGQAGVYVSLATGGGNFGPGSFKLAGFAAGAGGWNSEDHYPRELADVNGDGMADIVGFGEAGVSVSLATGGGNFGPVSFKLAGLAAGAGGWNSEDHYPRVLADVNGDHMADIVGFAEAGVYVALATGGGNFSTPTFKFEGFAPSAGGWVSDTLYHREVADVNGDGVADIVGFGQDGVFDALSNGFYHINHAPVVSLLAGANVVASAGQTLQASSLFGASDADGDALTYYLYDNTTATSGGHFAVNGTAVPRDVMYPVSAAQLAQTTTFVAGAAGTSDDLLVKAYDGHVYTEWSEFHILV
jgi:hypothetical protein